MTAYVSMGSSVNFSNSATTGNIASTDSVNPFTGATGVKFVKALAVNNTNSIVIDYVPLTATYEFANVSATGGTPTVPATFNVSVTYTGYVVTVNNPGEGYVLGDSLVIDGADVGGVTSTNDINLTVGGLFGLNGSILFVTVDSGTQVWPQTFIGSTTMGPNSEAYFQVINGNTPDGVYLNVTTTDGNVYIEPVQIVG